MIDECEHFHLQLISNLVIYKFTILISIDNISNKKFIGFIIFFLDHLSSFGSFFFRLTLAPPAPPLLEGFLSEF
jgi:hypothetical protein